VTGAGNALVVPDYTLKPEFVNAIKQALETLKILKKVEKPIDVDQFVNDRFIRQAAREFGYDYEARLKDYSPVPLEGKGFASGEEVNDSKKAGQISAAGEEKARLYKDVASTFAALATLEREGKKSRVVFVHDRENGLKLFADKVWYVRSGDDIAAFLEQSRAEKWAQNNNGKLLTYAEARKFVGGERVAQAR
jgi:NitT/TauT family transport system substrate-binding protein